ncbi:MAG: response regulator [Burkholderiaceae bacterium]
MPAEFRSYTTIEVARRLGVSLQTVQRWVDAGHLKAWKTIGGHRRIDAESAEALFNAQSSAVAPTPAEAGPPIGGDDGLNVLVVDDDPLDLELLTALVRKLLPSAAIVQAVDGFQALVIMGKRMPDVLITDLNMPHMDGFEMIKSLVSTGASRPTTILAVSSLSPSDLKARSKTLPEVRFMSKPVDEKRLAELFAGTARAAKLSGAA